MKAIDIAGQTFGRLTVLDRAGSSSDGRAMWICICRCGNLTTVRGTFLRSGKTRSCGCIHAEVTAQRNRENVTHGLHLNPHYNRWFGMMRRCYDPSDNSFHNYGARGITVHPEWHDIQAFVSYLEESLPPHEEGLSLDRIDVARGYEPGNVQWADRSAQARNRRPKSEWSAGPWEPLPVGGETDGE